MNPSHLIRAHKNLIVSFESSLHCTQVECICPITGIVCTINQATLPNTSFTYTHPLAIFENASKILSYHYEVPHYLQKLDEQILAGLVLSIYKHHDLIVPHKESSLEANLLLRSAGKELLINLLTLSRDFTSILLRYAPSFSLDWATHGQAQSLAESIQSYLNILRNIVHPPIRTKSEISTMPKKLALLTDKKQANFEEHFKLVKREAKEILADTLLPPRLASVLNQVFSKRNLLLINDEQRALLADKCKAIGLKRIAFLLTDTIDPTADIFASVDSALEKASESFSDKPKRTLAEILAAKRKS